MSHIIAGDPAPTNPTARMVGVTNRLILGILAGEERKPLLDAYRAEVRAEVLAEAIKAANAEYQPQDLTAPRTPYNEGVSDAVSALYRLAKAGPVKRAEVLAERPKPDPDAVVKAGQALDAFMHGLPLADAADLRRLLGTYRTALLNWAEAGESRG